VSPRAALAHEQEPSRPGRLDRVRERLALAAAFLLLALRYWLTVHPHVRAHIARARARARAISDPALRAIVLASLEKRSNIEGAGAFAALVPRATRRGALRALLAFQTIYNYADVLAEQPGAQSLADARRANLPLTCALGAQPPLASLYWKGPWMRDTGYLADLIIRCRLAIAELPGARAIAHEALCSASDIAEFQTHSRPAASARELELWARGRPPRPHGEGWRETAAACGSSVTVHALIAAAATPAFEQRDLQRLASVYAGPVAALHSMLDSLVDQDEDRALGQASLISLYPSTKAATAAMGEMATAAMRGARNLPGGRRHAVLVAAMAAMYLSDAEARRPRAAPIADAVRAGIGPLAAPAIATFALRRLAARKPPSSPSSPAADASHTEPQQPAAACARAS
jgi:tetraprenyl-beta-curcumene synthase